MILRGLSANPWSLWVENKCIQECGVEKDKEKGRDLSTLEFEECNALSVDKIEARLRQRTSSQSLWEAFVLHAHVFFREGNPKSFPLLVKK